MTGRIVVALAKVLDVSVAGFGAVFKGGVNASRACKRRGVRFSYHYRNPRSRCAAYMLDDRGKLHRLNSIWPLTYIGVHIKHRYMCRHIVAETYPWIQNT